MLVTLAHAWGEHEVGATIEVEPRIGSNLISFGKARVAAPVEKAPAKPRRRSTPAPSIPPAQADNPEESA